MIENRKIVEMIRNPSIIQRSAIVKDFWGVVHECKVMPRLYERTRFKTFYSLQHQYQQY